MADQQRRVKLIFEADANQVRTEINSLVSSLQKIQTTPKDIVNVTSIREASKAASELETHIRKAINMDTGKLDMSRFAESLSRSNKSLTDYANSLSRIGPTGNQAFMQLARGINSAEVSSVRLTKGMKDFLTTLKNTAKWQISSSMMHGFIGAIQTAYGYAQSLDRSLNDIRIVTGHSSEQMARFAEQANKSAQALSTTTTKYAEAALIFYQQGLGEKAVKERTDAVIKMANVTGEAAKDVSSYMTAIWNNFDNGSKSLEYYADVITKLGAATAASSEEIAGGLEKFAAIANTIGLSYEYATSMITTIVDKTRQSEDVVGTALKTILARIQGLNLGETLDDGTTLNKYSDALLRIGVSIKDASGQIKDMDSILDSLGSKWGVLSKDTQIALAQVVGGVRQYNQVISLMDNWGAFKGNVNIATNATGSLNEQAEIYAESWEAAEHRVKTAAQGIYDSLIDKDIFIQLDDILVKILNTIEGIVDGFGGMGGAITTVAGVFMTKFAKQVPVALSGLTQNLSILTGRAENKALSTQSELTQNLANKRDKATSYQDKTQYESLRQISAMREQLIIKADKMSSKEREAAEALIAQRQAIRDIVDEKSKMLAVEERIENRLGRRAERDLKEYRDNVKIADISSNLKEAEAKRKAGETVDIDALIANNPEQAQEYYQKLYEETMMQVQSNEGLINHFRRNAKRSSTARKSLQTVLDRQVGLEADAQYYQNQAQKAQTKANEPVPGIGDLKQLALDSAKAQKGLDALNGVKEKLNKPSQGKNALTEIKESIEVLKKSGKVSADVLKEVEEALSGIGDGAEASEDQINTLNAALEKAANSQSELVDKINQNRSEMINTMSDGDDDLYETLTDYDDRVFENEIDRQDIEDIDSEGKFNEIEGHASTVSESITAIAGAASSLYGVILSISGAWETIFSDDSATALEKIGAAIGAVTALLMAFNTVSQAGNTIAALQAPLWLKNAAAKLTYAGASKVAEKGTESLTTAVKAQNAALMANPWVALASILITVVVAAIGVAIAAHEKYIKTLKETAEASRETANSLQEEVNNNQELLNSYRSVQKAYENATASKQELADAALAAAEAYEIENAQLLIAQGNYGLLNSLLKDAEVEKKRELLNATARSVDDELAYIEATLNEIQLGTVALSSTENLVNNEQTASIDFISESEAAVQAGAEVITTLETVFVTAGTVIEESFNQSNLVSDAAGIVKVLDEGFTNAEEGAKIGAQLMASGAIEAGQEMGTQFVGAGKAVEGMDLAGPIVQGAENIANQTIASFNSASQGIENSSPQESLVASAQDVVTAVDNEFDRAAANIDGSNANDMLASSAAYYAATTADIPGTATDVLISKIPDVVAANENYIATLIDTANWAQKAAGNYTGEVIQAAEQAMSIMTTPEGQNRDNFDIISEVLGYSTNANTFIEDLIMYGSGRNNDESLLELLGWDENLFNTIFGENAEELMDLSIGELVGDLDNFKNFLMGFGISDFSYLDKFYGDNGLRYISTDTSSFNDHLFSSEGMYNADPLEANQYYISRETGALYLTNEKGFIQPDSGTGNLHYRALENGIFSDERDVDYRSIGSVLALLHDILLSRGEVNDFSANEEGGVNVTSRSTYASLVTRPEEFTMGSDVEVGQALTAKGGITITPTEIDPSTGGIQVAEPIDYTWEIRGKNVVLVDSEGRETVVYTFSGDLTDTTEQLLATQALEANLASLSGQNIQFTGNAFDPTSLVGQYATVFDKEATYRGEGKPITASGDFDIDAYWDYMAEHGRMSVSQASAFNADIDAAIGEDVTSLISTSTGAPVFHAGVARQFIGTQVNNPYATGYNFLGGSSDANILGAFANLGPDSGYRIEERDDGSAIDVFGPDSEEALFTAIQVLTNAVQLGETTLNGQTSAAEFNKKGYQYLTSDNEGKISVTFGDEYSLTDIPKIMEEINAAMPYLNLDADSEVYQNLQGMIEAGKSAVQMEGQVKDLAFAEVLRGREGEFGLGDLSAIRASTEEQIESVLANTNISPEALELAFGEEGIHFSEEDLIASLEKIGETDLALALRVTAEVDESFREDVRSYFDGLSDEEKTFYLTIDWTIVDATEDVQKIIDNLKAMAAAANIDATLTGSANLASDWGKVTTGAEAREFQTSSGLAWGTSVSGLENTAYATLKTFDEFLQMSYEDQIAYLEGYREAVEKNYVPIKQGGIEASLQQEAIIREGSGYYQDIAFTSATGEALIADNSIRVDGQDYYQRTDDEGKEHYYNAETGEEITETAGSELLTQIVAALETAANQVAQQEDYREGAEVEIAAHESITSRTDPIDERLKEEGFDREHYDLVRDAILEQNAALAENEELLANVTIQQMKHSRGVKAAEDNASDWVKTIKNGNKALKNGEEAGEDYYDAVKDIGKVYADLFNADYDDFSESFLRSAENAELLEKAVNGDTEAFDELQAAAAQDLYKEGLGELSDEVRNTLTEIADLDTVNVGDKIVVGESEIANQLGNLYDNAVMAALEGGQSVADAMATANSIINAVGYQAPEIEMVEKEVTVTGDLPKGWTPIAGGSVQGPDGQILTGVKWQQSESGQYSYTQTMMVPKSTSFTKSSESFGGGRRGGGGGGRGGGGSRAPRAEKKKDTEKERYHSIKNVLEDLNDNFEKISKARDRAFGKSRVKLMEEEEKALQDLAAAQKLYLDEIEANLVQDRNNLGQLQAYSGVELKFDENGTLLNFEDLQNAMWDKYNAQINGKGEVKNMTEEEWKKWEEEWQRQMDLLTQYEETQDLWKAEMQAYQDYINQIYDLRLEKVTYTVEVDLEASEHDLEFLQYMLDKIGDSAWDTAEAIANLSSQTEEYLGKLDENGEWDENGQAQDIQRGIAGILRNHSKPLPNADKKIGDVLDTDMSEYKEAVKKQQAALEALASGKDKGTTGKKTSSEGGGGGGRNTNEDKKEPDASIPTAPSQTILSEEDIQGFMNGDQAAIDKVIAMGNNGEFTEAEVEALKDYHSKLLETNKSLMELRDTMHEKVLAAFQGFNEELQEGIDKIDHLAQLTQNYRNIVDIVGKENLNVSNTLMEAMGQASVEQGIDRVQASKARRDSLKQMLEDARASRAAATNDEDRERWDENIKQMEADLRDAEEDFMQSWEDALTSIQEQFELAVTNTIETFSDALAGPLAGSLDELQASFDRQNNLAERYLPDYEKIYELNKLNRDITNSIDETDNVKAKQELADLQQEINALEEEGVEVSRYQTEDLRRRYELKLAEIALEEAKNAKSQVQMARDSDGNWSYVYTADEEDVAAAEQNYEDKMFALQQANAQYINEMQNSLIQTQAEMASEIEAIMMDETLSMEEKMQKVNELKEYYAEMFQYYSDELQLVMDNNGTAFEDTTLSALTGFTDLQDYEQNFYDATEAMLTDLGEAYDNWEANTEAAMNAAGTTMDDYADTMAEQTQAIVEESQEAADAVEDLGQRAVDAFDGITDAVENWVTTYGEKVNEILSTNEKLADSFRKVLEEWSDFDGKTEETTPPTEPNDGETEPEPEDEPEEEKKPEGLGTVTIKKGYRMNIRTGPGTGHRDIGTVDARKKKKSYTYSKKDGKWVYIDALGGWMNGQYKKYTYLTPFDTGGYTGAWGSEGRVAMLHEKEIVLNKEDTSNLLTAVDMIRQVAKIIDLNAYSSAGFGSSLIGLASGSAGQFEQNVHITAEFPNATNREEIYAAFTDIVNLASQYANR